jgi:hypothetical protein
LERHVFQVDRIRTTLFWVNAVTGAVFVAAAVLTHVPAYLMGALFWLVVAVFWRSGLRSAEFAEILARRINVATVAVLVAAIAVASAVEMANTPRAVANLALCAAVLGFMLRLWGECRAY